MSTNLMSKVELLFGFSFAAFVSLVAVFSLAASPSNDTKSIQSLFDRENRALVKGDTTVVLSFLAPDWVYIKQNGATRNKNEQARYLQRALKSFRIISASSKIDNLAVRNGEATLTNHTHVTMTARQPISPKSPIYAENTITRDVLARVGNKWLVRRVRVLADQRLINGRVVPNR